MPERNRDGHAPAILDPTGAHMMTLTHSTSAWYAMARQIARRPGRALTGRETAFLARLATQESQQRPLSPCDRLLLRQLLDATAETMQL